MLKPLDKWNSMCYNSITRWGKDAEPERGKHLRRADKTCLIKSHHRKEPDFAVYKCEPCRETRQPVEMSTGSGKGLVRWAIYQHPARLWFKRTMRGHFLHYPLFKQLLIRPPNLFKQIFFKFFQKRGWHYGRVMLYYTCQGDDRDGVLESEKEKRKKTFSARASFAFHSPNK